MTSQTVMSDAAWKWLQGVANTNDNKQFYEEGLALLMDVGADEVYASPIPTTPPTLALGATSADGVIKRVRMALTLDNSVPGNQAWVAVNPWALGWSSGSYDITQVMNKWVAPKHGPGYLPTFWGGGGGTTGIPPGDVSGPIFYPRAGLLTFQNTRSENGLAQATSIWVEGYVYTGLMQSDINSYLMQDHDFLATYLAART